MAEIGQLTSSEMLCLMDNKLTSVPAEIGQLYVAEVVDQSAAASVPSVPRSGKLRAAGCRVAHG